MCFQKHEPCHERRDAADDGDPGNERRAAVLEPVGELARIDELQRDPARERGGQDEAAQQRAEHGEATREGERERPEAGCTARLRDRDEVGEEDEERRHEQHRRDGERAAEHVRRPAAPQREPGERDEEERRHRDRAGPAEDLGREPVARVREDVELAGVLPERPLELVAAGGVRAGVAHDRQQPDEIRRGGSDERGERNADLPRLAPLDERAHDQETAERQPEKDRVRRMDDGEHEPGGGDAREQAAARPLDVCERKCERSRQQDLAGGRRRQPQSGVRAAVTRCERRHGDRAADHRHRRADAPEERPARLVGDEQRHRRKHGGLVEDDVRRVEEADPGDEREEAVPERERVAGVETTVGELIDGVERERAERIELPHAREVEEAVAADLPGDVPEQEPEHGACDEDPSPPRNPLRPRRGAPEPHCGGCGGEQQHERRRQRRADGKRHGERAEDQHQRPGERRRHAPLAERPRHERAGQQQHDVGEHELDERHRSSSSGIRPDANQSDVSRYIRPRSPRKRRPRSAVAARSSRRARSA